jgi:hypothetical protein
MLGIRAGALHPRGEIEPQIQDSYGSGQPWGSGR